MYNTQAVDATTSNDVSFIAPGIHDNIELTQIRKEVSKNGNNFVEFTFVNESGEFLKHTEYEPTRGFDEVAEDFEKKQSNQGARFYRIGSAFTSDPDLFKYQAVDFNDFVNKFIQRINPIFKGVKLRLKIVLNNKNYTTLPKYTTYTFIEPMSVEKSKISKLSIDKFEKTYADSEVKKENIFDSGITASKSKDALPF